MSGMISDENTTVSSSKLVQELNDEIADLMVPALVYIFILMVTGVIGNAMVFFYYGFKAKMTTNNFFIVALAVYDLIVCVICMPTEIADIELYYTFENDAACKVLRLLNNFASIASILTLGAIAVDRYRRIRLPTSKQMTLKIARLVSCVLTVTATVLSWPSAVLYGSTKVEIPNDLGRNLTGYDCTTTKDESYRPYVWAYYATHIILLIIFTFFLLTVYSIIGASLYKHRKRMSEYRITPRMQLSSVSITGSRSAENLIHNSLTKYNEHQDEGETVIKSSAENSLPSKSSQESKTVESMEDIDRKRSETTHLDTEAIKVTIVMIAITTLFVLSFMPYIALSIWRVKVGEHEAQFLSDSGLVGFKIGTRSFLLNSALNPWIYGIFNSKFRVYFYRLIRCCKKRN